MSYGNYLKQLCKYVFSSSAVLGVFIGVINLSAGESTANIDLEIDLGGPGGLWFIPGLPLIAVMIFAILSPLSFQIHKLLAKKESVDTTSDA